MPEFTNAYDCSDCPCLSRCHSESYCNLGYRVELLWREDRELIYCSNVCLMTLVEYDSSPSSGNTLTGYNPVEVKVTNIRPENW